MSERGKRRAVVRGQAVKTVPQRLRARVIDRVVTLVMYGNAVRG